MWVTVPLSTTSDWQTFGKPGLTLNGLKHKPKALVKCRCGCTLSGYLTLPYLTVKVLLPPSVEASSVPVRVPELTVWLLDLSFRQTSPSPK